jgi:hypothetical protein
LPVADYAAGFRAFSQSTATFEYVSFYGNDQHIRVSIGRIRYCPTPPCDLKWVEKLPSGEERTYTQGEHGKSGVANNVVTPQGPAWRDPLV